MYSLIARTRSDIRDVPLSISFSRVATLHRSSDPHQRGSGGVRIEGGEQRFERLRLDVLARQIRRHLPQVVLPVTAQQGINLVFQVADGQRIGRNFVALDEGRFQLFDFRFLGGGEVAPSQFVACVPDSFQDVAQLAGGALGGGSRIVEFMREPCRKLSQRSQAVALLLHPRGFANSVGHQADETLGQLRHLLYKIGKQRSRETQDAGVRERARAHGKLLHSRKGQHSGHVARLHRNHDCFAAEFAARLQLPLEDDKHRVGGIALAKVCFTRLETQLFRLADEPGNLIVGQIGECRDAKQFRFFDHLYLAQILMDELHGHRPFTDSGSDPFHRTVPHIAYRKKAGNIRLEQERDLYRAPTPWGAGPLVSGRDPSG